MFHNNTDSDCLSGGEALVIGKQREWQSAFKLLLLFLLLGL